MPPPVFSLAEVAAHGTTEDCWFVINGTVYDISGFLSRHPGGKGLLLANAGKDASEEFAAVWTFTPPEIARHTAVLTCARGYQVHSAAILADLDANVKIVGMLSTEDAGASTVSAFQRQKMAAAQETNAANNDSSAQPPPPVAAVVAVAAAMGIEDCLNADDFERVAQARMTATHFAYYSSGANDEHTLRGNSEGFGSFWLVRDCAKHRACSETWQGCRCHENSRGNSV